MVQKNRFIFPAEILLRVMISYSFGVKFAFFVNTDIPQVKSYFP